MPADATRPSLTEQEFFDICSTLPNEWQIPGASHSPLGSSSCELDVPIGAQATAPNKETPLLSLPTELRFLILRFVFRGSALCKSIGVIPPPVSSTNMYSIDLAQWYATVCLYTCFHLEAKHVQLLNTPTFLRP